MAMDEMQLAVIAVEEALRQGADQADARVNHLRSEDLVVRNGRLAGADSPDELGLGVRCFAGGAPGFAAAPLGSPVDEALARELGRRAARTARELSSAVAGPLALAPLEGVEASWETPCEIDPFGVPLADRLALLHAAERSMTGREGTVVTQASCGLRREEQWQATSEGARLHQVLVRTGAGISSTAALHGETQRRSYPQSFGGNYKSGGWEHVLAMDLAAHGPRVRDEALALCAAEPCPGGVRTLVLGGSQLMLQIHESVGHPNELDRVHGHEVDLAGSSFATPDLLGTFQYGSERVNLVADSTLPGGLDTRGFDDEGVPSTRFPVVEGGLFRGYHTSREWAGRLGETRSRSTARAEGWFHPPIVRITNLSLMPGEGSLEALLADCEDGAIYADTVKMWSIDQRRLNFQFTCEIAWEIQGGRPARLLRNPTYQGTTPEFWRSCDAICGPEEFELWGVVNCGKGNPMQVAEMTHGAAPARFRNVTFVGPGA
jgi:TldD protein